MSHLSVKNSWPKWSWLEFMRGQGCFLTWQKRLTGHLKTHIVLREFASIVIPLWKSCNFDFELSKGIYNRLPLTKCLMLDINLSNIAFSLPYEVKCFKSWLLFDSNGILYYSNEQNTEKSFGDVGFKPAIWRLEDWCLSKHGNQKLMIKKVKSDLLEPK